MSENNYDIGVQTFTVNENCYPDRKTLFKFPFIIQDICGLIKEMKLPTIHIAYIYRHRGSSIDHLMPIKDFADVFKSSNNWVLLTEAYASIEDYPEDKYYLDDKDATDGKSKVPLNNILEFQGKILSTFGFKTISDFVGLEYKDAYILNYGIGEKLYNEIFLRRINYFKSKISIRYKNDPSNTLLIRYELPYTFDNIDIAKEIIKREDPNFDFNKVEFIDAITAYKDYKWYLEINSRNYQMLEYYIGGNK